MLIGLRSQYEAQAGGTDGTATPTGLLATAALGTVTATGTAVHTVTGWASTGSVGTVTLSATATHTVTGWLATGGWGQVVSTGDALAVVTGWGIQTWLGDEAAEGLSPAAYYSRRAARSTRGRR